MHRYALLSLALLAGVAHAQPAGGLAGALENQPLILFGHGNPASAHPPETLAAQATVQIARVRALLAVKQPDAEQVVFYRRLRDSIFSIARASLDGRNLAVARALMPFATEEMGKAIKDGTAAYGQTNDPFGARADLYDVARAIRSNLRGADGKLADRALAVQFVRGLIGAVPYDSDRTNRQFVTQFEVHELMIELWPQLPHSGEHQFKDWIKLEEVDGDVGCWIDGLSKGLTFGGRKANISRLHTKIDALEQ